MKRACLCVCCELKCMLGVNVRTEKDFSISFKSEQMASTNISISFISAQDTGGQKNKALHLCPPKTHHHLITLIKSSALQKWQDNNSEVKRPRETFWWSLSCQERSESERACSAVDLEYETQWKWIWAALKGCFSLSVFQRMVLTAH